MTYYLFATVCTKYKFVFLFSNLHYRKCFQGMHMRMAIARDIKGKRERVVAVISNESIMSGQLYEAMSNAGYLDSDMVVILNDSRQSLHSKPEDAPKTPINSLSSAFSKLQSSRLFR
ncbi:putative 1-deoxy-D-xylulose-5-phosphate synthase [Helianthus annuus]|nr:putative 1-deoxy-D-xylulose-5-phosphate synthase [Helianthus annuus]